MTAPITYDPFSPANTRANILNALQALPTIGTGNIAVSTPATSVGPYDVTFQNALGGAVQAPSRWCRTC